MTFRADRMGDVDILSENIIPMPDIILITEKQEIHSVNALVGIPMINILCYLIDLYQIITL